MLCKSAEVDTYAAVEGVERADSIDLQPLDRLHENSEAEVYVVAACAGGDNIGGVLTDVMSNWNMWAPS